MAKKRKSGKKIGRPATGVNWRHLMLSMTPERMETAEQIGPNVKNGRAAKGIYALLDFARQNPAIVAKVISFRESTGNDKSNG